MGQLELLWKLQDYDLKLEQYKKELLDLEQEKNIEKLTVRLKELEYDLINKKTQVEVDNAKMQRLNNKLKHINFDFKRLENKLYGGKISNIKQLEAIKNEQDEIKEKAMKIEDEILELMEKVDKNSEDIDNLHREYLEIRDTLEKRKKEIKINIEDLKVTIERQEELILNIKNKLDDSLLKKYTDAKKRKGRVVVRVEGDKCTGCHMAIPLSTLSKIKHSNKVNYCDNCGRVLYYTKED
ncbi:zinc ribbon domain-containing protein [Clostridiisalibacter paucivorans]|uniref:zinc ribbon domain-containing protein n=1 Tax=Clostridiisalibacter paucivorans TaxID=408753 RepID=UPI00047B4661|nr:C4-type zinc ribbon domain-containing protein [Clostridiisalibacter paucivorans]